LSNPVSSKKTNIQVSTADFRKAKGQGRFY